MGEPVKHFVEGSRAWKSGVLGFLPRKRTVWATIGLTIATMSSPWWWELLISPLPPFLTFRTQYLVLVAALTVGAAVASLLLLLRRHLLQYVRVACQLHAFAHFLRNERSKLLMGAAAGKAAQLSPKSEHLGSVAEKMCELVKDLFVALTSDQSIETALRIVTLAASDSDQVVYRTLARTTGFGSNRDATTEAIPANQGVARFLLEDHNARGVLLYEDLMEAARQKTYQLTENDRLHPDDFRTMMVAPLNAWAGTEHRMIGILYITSCRKFTFRDDHTDYVRFVADTVADALSTVVEFLAHEDANEMSGGSAK